MAPCWRQAAPLLCLLAALSTPRAAAGQRVKRQSVNYDEFGLPKYDSDDSAPGVPRQTLITVAFNEHIDLDRYGGSHSTASADNLYPAPARTTAASPYHANTERSAATLALARERPPPSYDRRTVAYEPPTSAAPYAAPLTRVPLPPLARTAPSPVEPPSNYQQRTTIPPRYQLPQYRETPSQLPQYRETPSPPQQCVCPCASVNPSESYVPATQSPPYNPPPPAVYPPPQPPQRLTPPPVVYPPPQPQPPPYLPYPPTQLPLQPQPNYRIFQPAPNSYRQPLPQPFPQPEPQPYNGYPVGHPEPQPYNGSPVGHPEPQPYNGSPVGHPEPQPYNGSPVGHPEPQPEPYGVGQPEPHAEPQPVFVPYAEPIPPPPRQPQPPVNYYYGPLSQAEPNSYPEPVYRGRRR